MRNGKLSSGGVPHSPYRYSEIDAQRTPTLLAKSIYENQPSVTLIGGEPPLRQDLSKILGFLRQRVTQITIVSNGGLTTSQPDSGQFGRAAALIAPS